MRNCENFLICKSLHVSLHKLNRKVEFYAELIYYKPKMSSKKDRTCERNLVVAEPKKAKTSGKGDMLPHVYHIPEIPEVPSKAVPIVTLNLKLVSPPGFVGGFSIEMPITAPAMILYKKIEANHAGSARNIKVSFHQQSPMMVMPLDSTLMDLGILEAGEIEVYYDFTPTSHPLLNLI